MQHFVNHGYGWTCLRCQRATAPPPLSETSGRGRFFSEGEAEEREPKLSDAPRARWRDDTRRALRCPRCGVEETLED